MRHVIWITIAVLITIVAMSLLPEGLTIGTYHVLPGHALEGLLSTDESSEAVAEADSVAQLAVARVDTCKPQMTCIADFADDEQRGMTPLYDALVRRRALGRPVRIAVLGDSYIQCDIFTAPLREALQRYFGGSGVGMVPISNSSSNRYRRSVKHDFGAWNEHLANKRSGYRRSKYKC